MTILLALLLIATGADAAGKLVSTQEKLIVIPYYDTTHYAYVFAELTNSGDKPVAYANGLMELFDPDGNSIAANSVYSSYPPVLQPAETGYLYASSYIEAPDPEHIDDFMLSVTGQGSITQTVTRLDAAGRFEAAGEDYGSYDTLVAEISNTQSAPLTSFEVVFAVKDQAGDLIHVISSYWSGYNLGIMPGSSVEMRQTLDHNFSTYMRDNGIAPAAVEVIAYYTE